MANSLLKLLQFAVNHDCFDRIPPCLVGAVAASTACGGCRSQNAAPHADKGNACSHWASVPLNTRGIKIQQEYIVQTVTITATTTVCKCMTLFHFYFTNEVTSALTIHGQDTIEHTMPGFSSRDFNAIARCSSKASRLLNTRLYNSSRSSFHVSNRIELGRIGRKSAQRDAFWRL
jgi:hypothetical protein